MSVILISAPSRNSMARVYMKVFVYELQECLKSLRFIMYAHFVHYAFVVIGESRRIVMKEVLKTQGEGVDIKSRAVPQSAIDHYRCRGDGFRQRGVTGGGGGGMGQQIDVKIFRL